MRGLCVNTSNISLSIYVIVAITNVAMNAVFILLMDATGTATAFLITQIITSIIFLFFAFKLKQNAKMMFDAIFSVLIFDYTMFH